MAVGSFGFRVRWSVALFLLALFSVCPSSGLAQGLAINAGNLNDFAQIEDSRFVCRFEAPDSDPILGKINKKAPTTGATWKKISKKKAIKQVKRATVRKRAALLKLKASNGSKRTKKAIKRLRLKLKSYRLLRKALKNFAAHCESDSPAAQNPDESITPPTCGNGVLEGQEQCDDGNTRSRDGCSKECLVEALTECNDGVDNDGDGNVDWFTDLGCINSSDQTEGGPLGASREDGWTVFEDSSDTLTVYVSSSEGNDSFDGLSPNKPKKTILAGYELLRNSYPDRLLLKRGDRFVDEPFHTDRHWKKNGRTDTEPMVLSSYGDRIERPLILGGGINLAASHIAIVGLDFRRAGGGTAFNIMASISNILVEDCRVAGYSFNFNLNGPRNFTLRRSQILDAYTGTTSSTKAQGIFAVNVNGLYIEENLFDHNGWRSGIELPEGVGQPNGINHNLYISTGTKNAVIRDNIIARAASHGIQLRPGGRIERNLFIDNALAAFVAADPPHNKDSTFIDNAVIGGRWIDAANARGEGLSVIGTDAVVRNNLIAHKPCEPGRMAGINIAINDLYPATVSVTDNIIYNWCGNFEIGMALDNDVVIANNIIQDELYERPVVTSFYDLVSFGITYYRNTYHSGLDPEGSGVWDAWYHQENSFDDRYLAATEWTTASGEEGASFEPVSFFDPGRNVERYQQSLGGRASKEEFLQRVRNQSRQNWDSRYTAQDANAYFRAGFSLTCSASETLACPNQTGVCQGSTRVCSSGSFPASCLYSDLVPAYEADELTCDGLDNDCDGEVDEGCDDDNDDLCDASMEVALSYSCSGSANCCVYGPGDCNDTDSSIFPDAIEQCDTFDNQCPGDAGYGSIDEGCQSDDPGFDDRIRHELDQDPLLNDDLDPSSLLFIDWIPGQGIQAVGSPGAAYNDTSGLIAHYRFEDDVLDSSGLGNDLIGEGYTFVDGINGRAINFDGSDNILELDDTSVKSTIFNFKEKQQATFNVWAKLRDVTRENGNTLIRAYVGSPEYILEVQNSGLARFLVYGLGDAYSNYPLIEKENQWVMLTGVATEFDHYVRLYIDGELHSEIDAPGHFQNEPHYPIYFGTNHHNNKDHLDGLMDEITIWDRALSADEVLKLRTLGSFQSNPVESLTPIYGLTPMWEESGDGIFLEVSFDNGTSWCRVQNEEEVDHTTAGCGLSAENPPLGFLYRVSFLNDSILRNLRFVWNTTPPPACSDLYDNDGDGWVDTGDPGCENAADNNEANSNLGLCADGLDNDSDSLVDGADPICTKWSDNREAARCSDGIDNDGDGQVDGADAGCEGPEDNHEVDDNLVSRGWTELNKSIDTQVIYVSSSDGHDLNDGLSPRSPVKTVTAGYDLLRDGYPDWLLLKRGDTWVEEPFGRLAGGDWRKSGRSAAEPMVVNTYGVSSERPLLSRMKFNGTPDHLYLIGLHFERIEGHGSGITVLGDGTGILVEDCVIQGYTDGFNVQGAIDFTLRRSHILDAHRGRAQGMFASDVTGLLIEENVIDHNGWREVVSPPTVLNHNLYLSTGSTNVVVRKNIISRASSHGVQLRPGGLIEENLFIENALAAFIAGDPPTNPNAAIRSNIALGGDRELSLRARGEGFATINASGSIENNILAHKSCAPGEMGPIAVSSVDKDGLHVNVAGNIAYNWCGTTKIDSRATNTVNVTDNIIQDFKYETTGALYSYGYSLVGGNIAYLGNIYHTVHALDQGSAWGFWFRYKEGDDTVYASALEWPALSGDYDTEFRVVDFVDPDRDLTSYLATLGITGSNDIFIENARKLSRFNWDTNFTADSVNTYIRAGFQEGP